MCLIRAYGTYYTWQANVSNIITKTVLTQEMFIKYIHINAYNGKNEASNDYKLHL